jgi:hypothetical protein
MQIARTVKEEREFQHLLAGFRYTPNSVSERLS